MAGRGAQRAYGPLLQRMLEEQEQLERVSMTRITASFVGGLDLPPLAQGRSRISNASPALPDASHLQRVKTLGALDGVAPRRALRGSASTSRLDASSAYAAMSLAAAGRQRKSVAATHRENVVLKARIADLEALAHHHAAELARLRDAQSTLHETAAERVSKIAVLREISKVLSDTDVDSATMIARLVEMTATALNCERVSLFLLSEDGTELYLKTANDCAPDIRVPVGAGIVGNVAQTKELVNIRDAQSDPRFFKVCAAALALALARRRRAPPRAPRAYAAAPRARARTRPRLARRAMAPLLRARTARRASRRSRSSALSSRRPLAPSSA